MELKMFKRKYGRRDIEGLFLFVVDGCGSCDMMKTNLNKNNISYDVIECSPDVKYFLSIGLDDMPTLVYYKDGDEVYKKEGVLFDTQIQQLKKVLANV
jgi:glutaredoxin-related protein